MGNVDRDAGQLPEQRAKLASKLTAGLDVEGRQRLVEKKKPGTENDRASDGRSLLLPSRELAGQPAGQARDTRAIERLLHPRLQFSAGRAGRSEPECHILEDGEMGKEGEVLGDVSDVAGPGSAAQADRRVNVDIGVELDAPTVGMIETCQESEDGGLSRPALSHENSRRAGWGLQRDGELEGATALSEIRDEHRRAAARDQEGRGGR